jgi:Holliday junction resolvase RusA-like endonuclease
MHFDIPMNPKGKARHRQRVINTKEGKSFAHTYADPKQAKYVEELQKWIRRQYRLDPLTTPLSLDVFCVMEIPKSWSKKKVIEAEANRIKHVQKPDLDNLVKMIKDAMNKIVWADDCQIVRTKSAKEWGKVGGWYIRVTEVKEGEHEHKKPYMHDTTMRGMG